MKVEPTQDPDEIKVHFKKPSGNSEVDFSVETEVDVESGRDITKVEFYVDGAIKNTKNGNNSNVKFNFTFAAANKGKHKIKVKAFNEAGRDAENEIEVSVGEPWS